MITTIATNNAGDTVLATTGKIIAKMSPKGYFVILLDENDIKAFQNILKGEYSSVKTQTFSIMKNFGDSYTFFLLMGLNNVSFTLTKGELEHLVLEI